MVLQSSKSITHATSLALFQPALNCITFICAKELPIIPPDEVTRMEFNMKDQMIRNTILDTQKDVEEIKGTLEKIEDKLYNR